MTQPCRFAYFNFNKTTRSTRYAATWVLKLTNTPKETLILI